MEWHSVGKLDRHRLTLWFDLSLEMMVVATKEENVLNVHLTQEALFLMPNLLNGIKDWKPLRRQRFYASKGCKVGLMLVKMSGDGNLVGHTKGSKEGLVYCPFYFINPLNLLLGFVCHLESRVSWGTLTFWQWSRETFQAVDLVLNGELNTCFGGSEIVPSGKWKRIIETLGIARCWKQRPLPLAPSLTLPQLTWMDYRVNWV